MNEFFASVGGTAWTVAFFIIGLSVIVFVHEYGHYIVGRWTGIHAEVFSIGFGRVLWRRIDRRGTQWQIAAIPFGGYVKFLGDADATSTVPGDVSGLSTEERRHTMAGAPLWARAATVAAGPLANFILTFALLAALIMANGIVQEVPSVGKLRPLPYADQGLAEGDRILALAGTPTPDWESFASAAKAASGTLAIEYLVERQGEKLTVMAPHPDVPVIGGVQLRSGAMDAGLRSGDVILRAGGRDIIAFADIIEVVAASEGKPVPLSVWREGTTFDVTFSPRLRPVEDEVNGGFTEKYLLGLYSGQLFEPGLRRATVGEVVSGAAQQMLSTVQGMLAGLRDIVTGKIGTCNFSGVIGIAETLGDAAETGPFDFLGTLALLSLGIGLMNLFPIPALDGGHLVFYAVEAVIRRPPPEAALRLLMTAGIALVLAATLFALSRDLLCA